MVLRPPASLALLVAAGLLAPARARAAEPTRVSIDARGSSDEDYRRLGLLELQRKLALRLAQAGFAVVAAGRQPAVELRLRALGEEVRIEAWAGGQRLEREVARSGGDLSAYHLEVIHKCIEAARQLEQGLARAAATAAGPGSPSSRAAPAGPGSPSSLSAPLASRSAPAAPPRPAPVSPAEPWSLELLAEGAALLRVQPVDPLARFGLRLGAARRGVGLALVASLCPASAQEIGVLEWSLQAGASYRLPAGGRLFLEGGILIGYLQHRFELPGAAPGTGSRTSLLLGAPLHLGWQLLRRLVLRVFVAPGFTEAARSHRLDGTVIWERSAFRLEAGGGIALGLY